MDVRATLANISKLLKNKDKLNSSSQLADVVKDDMKLIFCLFVGAYNK